MAGRRLRASAFGLVVLLVASTWLGALTAYDGDSIALGEQSEPSLVGVGDTVDLTLTTLPNSNFDLDLPADEPLVSAELNFTPKVLPSQQLTPWLKMPRRQRLEQRRNAQLNHFHRSLPGRRCCGMQRNRNTVGTRSPSNGPASPLSRRTPISWFGSTGATPTCHMQLRSTMGVCA